MSDNRDEAGRFRQGCSGNPAGRPLGARNKSTRVVEALFGEHAEALAQVLLHKALAGEDFALKLVMQRAAPAPKGRPVEIALPEMDTAGQVKAAMAATARAIAAGEITPAEGEIVSQVIERQRRVVETADLERRLERVEDEDRAERAGPGGRSRWWRR